MQKIIKPLPGIIFSQNDEIGRKSENKILVENSVHTRPGKKIPKENSNKIKKN